MWLFSLLTLGYAFITEWQLESYQAEISLPFSQHPGLVVDWGDGKLTTSNTHTYDSPGGRYNISIDYALTDFNFRVVPNADKTALVRILSWGTFELSNGSAGAFEGCSRLQIDPSAGQPVILPDADLSDMFMGCESLDARLEWDVANVTRASGMFAGAINQKQPILFTNTEKIQYMEEMFRGTYKFFQNLSSWHVSNATTCLNFCPYCVLPSFVQCVPCANIDRGRCTRPFTATWNTALDNTITLPLHNAVYNLRVDWNDSSPEQDIRDNTASHLYTSPGEKTIRIYGDISGFRFKDTDIRANLTGITWWGGFVVDETSDGMFAGCTGLKAITALDQPKIVGVDATMRHMFLDCSSLNSQLVWDLRGVVNVNGMFKGASSLNSSVILNTATVKNMSEMFSGATSFNSPLNLTTQNVTDMSGMFKGAIMFDQKMNFDTSNVQSMDEMFSDAQSFNQPIEFNTSNVKSMTAMFAGATRYNNILQFSSTRSVTSMKSLFQGASSFNSPIHFDTSSTTSFSFMFADASNFSQPINFDTTQAEDIAFMFLGASVFNSSVNFTTTKNVVFMNGVFERASQFNQPLTSFETTSVTRLDNFLKNAHKFNQPLNHFDTSKVTNMSEMFLNATSFNQELNFNTTNVQNMDRMFVGASLIRHNLTQWQTAKTTTCQDFCLLCTLPAFPLCAPCVVRSTSTNERVCVCPGNEFPVFANQCAASSDSQGVISLPAATSRNVSLGSSILVVVPVDLSFGSGGTVVVRAQPATPDTVSTIASITFFGQSNGFTPLNISGLSSPLYVEIALPATASAVSQACVSGKLVDAVPECAWLNENNQWQTSQCATVFVTATKIGCNCFALGQIAAVLPGLLVPSIRTVPLTAAALKRDSGGLATVLVVLLCLAIFLGLSVRRDYQERARGVQRAVKFEHWGRALAQWHWWRCLYPYLVGLQSYHSWGGLFYRKSGISYRSVDRAAVVALVIFTVMSLSARSHQPEVSQENSGTFFLYGILCPLLPMWVLIYLFTHTGPRKGFYEEWQSELGLTKPLNQRCFHYRFPERCRWLWYLMVFASVLGMIIYVLMASLRFDQNPVNFCSGEALEQWIQDFLIVYVALVCMLEPLTICVYVRIVEDRVKTAFLRNGFPPPAPAPSRVEARDLEMNEMPPLRLGEGKMLPVTPAIPFSELEITGVLGQGAFGRVEQCIWDGADCAVKRLLNPEAEAEFSREVTINRHMYAFKHQFVVNFLGITSHPPGMLLELYPLRSVEDFVIRGGALAAPADLVNIVTVLIGASAGVLHLHKHGVIHRDIAARNFLIKHDLSTAICDFGLALLLPADVTVGQRTIAERKTDMLPVTTTAPETLAKGEYSAKSDVYMFGIFIWELLARRQPHRTDKDLAAPTRNFYSFSHRVLEGLRPPLYADWPEELRTLMMDCWAGDPASRPSMTDVNRALRAFRSLVESNKLSLPTIVSSTNTTLVSEDGIYDEGSYYGQLSVDQSSPAYETYVSNPGFADRAFNEASYYASTNFSSGPSASSSCPSASASGATASSSSTSPVSSSSALPLA